MLGIFLLLSAITRIGLALWVSVAGEPGHVGQLLAALFSGLPIDLATACWFLLPFFMLFVLLQGLFRRRWAAGVAHLFTYVSLTTLLFMSVAEFFFWNEFDSRFNGIAVNYLIFPREVIGNIGESFNLSLYLPMVMLAGAGLYLLAKPALVRAVLAPLPWQERLVLITAAAVALLAAIPVLRHGPVAIGDDREVAEIADNGLRSLFAAFLTNDTDYDGLHATIDDRTAVATVRADVAQDNTSFVASGGSDLGGGRSLWRHVDNGGQPKKLNIVLVIEESFGSTYLDSLDNSRPYAVSPELTRLADDGLLFTNVYATGDRTVRGLEALLTSFTPIPGISTVRRAGSEGMNSLAFLLKKNGYQTAFLYGGASTFDNMGHFWSTTGFDQVWDQGDIEKQDFSTIWGVADEFLFTEAIKRLDAATTAGAPMFLSMLTVSNHRPYTFPQTHVQVDPAMGDKENSAHYAAWAFTDFLERSKSRPWFKETVFVFVGDHGPRVAGAAQVPVERFRVPLLFYSPGHIKPGRNATLGSSMDMAPTLLGLLGWSYDSPFFGLDLRRVPDGQGRVAMAHNYSVAYGRNGKVVVLGPKRDLTSYRMEPGPHPLVPDAAVDADLSRHAISATQTAHRMFYGHQYHGAWQ
ncbi:MAG TPA: sulfatase-like hydrolase/transferase [Geminicoccus sp.]|uniref:LTA synthase family protein n=1 Tax=Geminicoccus sp. TaxID=2024832 RepID=UPI002E3247FD|nr:sulfatase-like hydrolase/transferase [Geminicoccus sp.]HEX2527111.1 sulfatase-like hydrolase/transferase [Geminicoccus sp.]